jgi:hypothetical protein
MQKLSNEIVRKISVKRTFLSDLKFEPQSDTRPISPPDPCQGVGSNIKVTSQTAGPSLFAISDWH